MTLKTKVEKYIIRSGFDITEENLEKIIDSMKQKS